MKPAKTKSQSHKLALRRETLVVLTARQLARVAGGQEIEWPTVQSYGECLQQN